MSERRRNKTESAIHRQLNPRALQKSRKQHAEDMAARRLYQDAGAYHFLTTGNNNKGGKPPWGKEWDRDYNPVPYPEARPEDLEFYQGTGIGYLYNVIGCEHHAWQMAGWNLVRTGSEHRRRKQ